jgi:serine/threonine-protein kinase
MDGEMPPPLCPLPDAVAQVAAGLLVAPERAGPGGLPVIAGYEILGLLGRGGMGLVYQARQVKLGRMVALKMIRGGAHADPRDLARFRAEAEAVAQLQHPHIVPIYEVGEQDGWAYFALELVAGGSLARQLAGRPQPAEPSARLVETLAQAMEHAHQRGVIHRDLKPANILLQPLNHKDHEGHKEKTEMGVGGSSASCSSWSLWFTSCTPKISDFGLAKRLDPGPATPAGDPTRTGEVLGTPSYMAPEQTLGRPGAVGPAADVYALGAILYECLTGRPPFQGATPLDTLLQVRTEEPVPPRRLVPSVPRDLDTICRACLHKEPRRRYPSAAALAADLRRFLAGQPVQARPAGLWERARRWARRRKAAAALIGVSGLAVMSLLALGGWHYAQLQEHNAELRDERRTADQLRALAQARATEAQHQKNEVEKQWRRADANFQKALAAVKQMLTRVSEDEAALAHEPRMELVRRKLLHDALALYQGFLKERGSDPVVRWETASTYLLVGDIQKQLGQEAAAEDAYNAAIRLFRALVAELPQRPAYRYELAGCYTNLATLRLASHRVREAEQGFRQALDLQAALVKENPAVEDYRSDLAGSYHNLGTLLINTQRVKEGEKLLREALRQRRRLAEANPAKPEWRQDVARTQYNLGLVAQSTNRPREAMDHYDKALAVQRRLVQDLPRVPAYRHELAASHQSRAVLLAQASRLREAEAEYGRAADLLQRLAEDFPRVPVYRQDLALNHHNLAVLWDRTKQVAKAEQAYRRALDLQRALVKEHSQVPGYQSELGNTYSRLAELLLQQGQLTEARRQGEQAVQHQQAALKLRPGQPAFGRALGHHYRILAETLLRLGDHAAAAAAAAQLPRYLSAVDRIYPYTAGLLARCVPLAQRDSTLPVEKRETLAKTYGDQAMDLLRRGIRHGPRPRADQLKATLSFASLRTRADFQKLVRELERGDRSGGQ